MKATYIFALMKIVTILENTQVFAAKMSVRMVNHMKEVFENILARLNEIAKIEIHCGRCNGKTLALGYVKGIENAIKIVNEVTEEFATDTNVGTNGWIPCSERLPEEPFGCLVTVIDCEPVTQNEFENILPYFVGYDGHSWNDADGNEIPFEVIAWQPLPKPFTEIKQ